MARDTLGTSPRLVAEALLLNSVTLQPIFPPLLSSVPGELAAAHVGDTLGLALDSFSAAFDVAHVYSWFNEPASLLFMSDNRGLEAVHIEDITLKRGARLRTTLYQRAKDKLECRNVRATP